MMPELLTPITYAEAGRYVVSGDYFMQEKIDAKRLLVVKDARSMTAFNKLGTPCAMPPELAERMKTFFGDQRIALDGEWIARRNLYCLWDILQCAHMDMRGLSYEQRLEPLLTLNRVSGFEIVTTYYTPDDKERNLTRLLNAKAEGVVFKNRHAHYRPGRARQHFKLKFVKTCTCRIGNVEDTNARIYMLDRGRWIEVGGVSLVGKPFRPKDRDFIEVKYLCGTPDKHLREPVMLGLGPRDDVQDSDCDFSTVVVKE